ncbi:TPA: DEAD/DEAH box helicase [Salmonella enterica subsp. enterica serovar Typhi str. AG3]|nr:DEAD/DEAH box helicase [Salmonella enterica subsp. enterica serovar Typhi str. AG3]
MKMNLSLKEKEGFKFESQSSLNDELHQQLLIEKAKLFLSFRLELFKGNQRNRTAYKSNISWDMLLHNNIEKLSESNPIKTLQEFGVDIKGLNEAEKRYQIKKKEYDFFGQTIEEYMETEHFQKAKRKVQEYYDKPLEDGSELFSYQVDCAALIVGRRRLLNAFDMGLGKTRTTLAGLTSDPRNKKIIIVTMSRNIHDWIHEIEVLGLEEDFIQLSSPTDLKSSKRIHLVSYEKWADDRIKYKKVAGTEDEYYSAKNLPEFCPSCSELWKEDTLYCSCGETVVSSRKKALYKYFNRSYDAAAIDEGHLIKNGSTSRNKSIMAIKTKTRVLLSGTPAESGATDLFWLLAWLMGDSHHFWNKVNYSRFDAYGKYGERSFKHTYGGVSKTALVDSASITSRTSNVKELWKLQDIVMFRKMKQDEDVKNQVRVPKPTHRRLHLEQTQVEKDLYKKILQDFSEWFKEMEKEKNLAKAKGLSYKSRTIEICSWLEKLRLAASCPWIFEDYSHESKIPPSKLSFLRDKMQQEARQKKKMLIFTAHKKTCEELGVLLNTFIPGYEVGHIHGSVPMEHRKNIMARFQDENDSMSVLIMTMKTGAESYTLTQAKSVVLFDLDYNPKKIEQCYSRAVRLGQRDVVDVTWLISVDTIDANMHALVLSKQSSVDLAIDRQELDFEQVAKEFEGQGISGIGSIDYEAFAKEMLSRGTTREEYENAV